MKDGAFQAHEVQILLNLRLSKDCSLLRSVAENRTPIDNRKKCPESLFSRQFYLNGETMELHELFTLLLMLSPGLLLSILVMAVFAAGG